MLLLLFVKSNLHALSSTAPAVTLHATHNLSHANAQGRKASHTLPAQKERPKSWQRRTPSPSQANWKVGCALRIGPLAGRPAVLWRSRPGTPPHCIAPRAPSKTAARAPQPIHRPGCTPPPISWHQLAAECARLLPDMHMSVRSDASGVQSTFLCSISLLLTARSSGRDATAALTGVPAATAHPPGTQLQMPPRNPPLQCQPHVTMIH